MVKLEKILCFIFTLFIVYLVNKQCIIENLINYNSFNTCIDDPNWYTLGEKGEKYYCRDIGTSASCYDMDPLQQEGWEKCLNTCGNCANTQVSLAPMNNLAMKSGDSGEDFDKYEIDDTRKWVGLDVGGDDKMDVRESLTKDSMDDIVDIYDRLKIVEDMYDMLLSSVSSCIDCSQYNETNCPVEDNCKIEQGNCVINESQTSGTFRSCNGSELPCIYTITQPNNDDTSESSTEEVSGDSVTHTYVKHYCDEHGVCSILFPTYDISCDSIPEPRESIGYYPTIDYEPKSTEPRKCLSSNYYTEPNDNITASESIINITPNPSPDGHICRTNITDIAARNMTSNTETDDTINIVDGEVWVTDQIVRITPKISTDNTNCNFDNIKVRVNAESNTLTLINNTNDQELNTADITNLVTNCKISREGGRIGQIIDKCYYLDETQIDDNDEMKGKKNCAIYCNSISPMNRYITIYNSECRCYSDQPPLGDNVISPSGECANDNIIEFLDEGQVLRNERMIMGNIDQDEQIRDMCKNYFLLETSLDEDETGPDDTLGNTGFNSIDGMSGRISLYDVCPTQCKAIGCETTS